MDPNSVVVDVEHIGLSLAAIGLLAAFLLLIADTPFYPVAFGVLLITLIYLAGQSAWQTNIAGVKSFIAKNA